MNSPLEDLLDEFSTELQDILETELTKSQEMMEFSKLKSQYLYDFKQLFLDLLEAHTIVGAGPYEPISHVDIEGLKKGIKEL